jgi:hypothetical protein
MNAKDDPGKAGGMLLSAESHNPALIAAGNQHLSHPFQSQQA